MTGPSPSGPIGLTTCAGSAASANISALAKDQSNYARSERPTNTPASPIIPATQGMAAIAATILEALPKE